MYSVIQFGEKDGGTVSIINNQWFTPRKCEVFWPPVKGTKAFERILADAKTPNEKWKLYSVQRVFCETDDIEKAKKKLKLAEESSDLQTEAEGEPSQKRKRAKRHFTSSDEDEDDNHIRPPQLKKKTLNTLQKFQATSNACLVDTYEDTHQAQPKDRQESPSTPEKTLSILNVVDGLPVLTDSVLQDLAEDGDERLTPVARLASPRRRYEQPPNLSSDVPATQSRVQGLTDTIISLLSEIKVQNQKIIALLTNSAHTYYEPLHEDFKFPIQNEEEMITTETLLAEDSKRKQLVSYLKSLGGREVKDKVTRLMKFTLADNLARQYNYYGKRSDKKPFSESRLRHCVIEAVKATTAKVTDREIEDTIKNWLKHAPEREKKRLSRNASQKEQQD